MRNKRLIIALLAAVAFGLVAAISVSQYLARVQTYTKNLNQVVIAKVEIPVGSRIIAEQLAVAQFPRNVTPEGAYTSMDKLLDRVAVVRIAAREPVTESRLAPVGAAGGLSSVIPEGFRAMTVKVDEVVGVSGFIMPGTLVDIVVVTQPPKASGQEEMVSKIVLQNIKVLASGQNIDKPKNDRDVERAVRAVTLQVTPEQAEKLALAASEGKLQLVMRSQIDQGDEKTTGVNKRNLLGGDVAKPVPEPGSLKSEQPKSEARPVTRRAPVSKSEAAPAPQATPRTQVEMIEGGKKRNVDFP